MNLGAVALRKESVDRNTPEEVETDEEQVALRKESVDRNIQNQIIFHHSLNVALRKESVDRNNEKALLRTDSKVALRKESVDRNCGAYRPGPGAAGRSPQGERG